MAYSTLGVFGYRLFQNINKIKIFFKKITNSMCVHCEECGLEEPEGVGPGAGLGGV